MMFLVKRVEKYLQSTFKNVDIFLYLQDLPDNIHKLNI